MTLVRLRAPSRGRSATASRRTLSRVVAGELGAAQDAGQRGGAVLGGETGAVVAGDGAVGGELVEPAPGALGGGEVGGVGEELAAVRVLPDSVADSVAVASAEADSVPSSRVDDPGEDGDGVAVQGVVGGASRRRGRSGPVMVATWAVLASRPRVSPT